MISRFQSRQQVNNFSNTTDAVTYTKQYQGLCVSVRCPVLAIENKYITISMESSENLNDRDGKQTSIKVFIRVRPLIGAEVGTQEVVEVQEDNKTLHISDNVNTIQSKFDQVFRQSTQQIEIFRSLENFVPKIAEGYNLTIFAYGQTGSGKTYTMFGNDWENLVSNTNKASQQQKTFFEELETDQNYAGITPRAIYLLFKAIGANTQQNINEPKFKIFCSFLQIYNEKVYDLLQDVPKPRPLNIHESKIDGIFVEGLSEYSVTHHLDCLQLMTRGEKNRIIRNTSMNAKSSRSHTIFQILLESAHADPKGIFKVDKVLFQKARLNLCDLAGSEKVNKYEQMGEDHFKELKNINQSLTTLGKVIYSLSSGGKAVASFRQSKLTRLLQDSLTSNTFTFIVGNISPSITNLDETLSTLKFVERARHIVMKVKPVEFNGLNAEMVLKLQKQVMYLKELLNLKRKGLNAQDMHAKLMALQEQNERLKKTHVSIQEVEKLIEENRKMKMEISKIQMTQYMQSEDNSETKSSVSLSSSVHQHNKGVSEEKRSDGFSLQIDSNTDIFKKKSSTDAYRTGNSLVSAGRNVVEGTSFSSNSKQLDNSMQAKTPMRTSKTNQSESNRQKQKILERLEQLERIQKFNEEKLYRQLEMMEKKHSMTTPNKKNPREEVQRAQKKIINYEDKIKELELKLFNK